MIEIRSYRRVFDLERRIYRIDRMRLNPSGVPVRGVVYMLALLATILIAAHMPVIGLAVRQLPWFVRWLGFPGLTAALLTAVRIEGRPFHLAARALIRHRMRRSGKRAVHARAVAQGGARAWAPPPLLMLADGSDGPRRVRYRGPGAALVAIAHERHSAKGLGVRLRLRPDVLVSPEPGRALPPTGTVIVLERNSRLTVR